MNVYLEKIDPVSNCYRFYEIRTEHDLFAERALVLHWGRIGRSGRRRIVGSGKLADVESLATRILRLKRRHGYAEPPEFAEPEFDL